MIWDIMQTGRSIIAGTAGVTDATDESVSDMIDTAAEATSEAAQEVNQLVKFVQDNIPNIIGFGIKVLLALLFFFLGGKLIKWLRKVVRRSFERTNMDAGVAQFVDSLALQGSLSNFAGGILILLLKPFAVGDYIVVTQEGIEGTVKEIQIFYTKMATVDNQTVVVPNSILTSNSLTNVTARPERQLDLKVGIGYESDLKKAKKLIEDMLYTDPSVIQDEEIKVFVDSLGDSAVVIGLRAWVKTEEYWATRWRLLEQIKVTFDAEGIEIPYNQLTVNVKTEQPELLRK